MTFWSYKSSKTRKKQPDENHCVKNWNITYGIFKYLIEIIQPTLNKNKHCAINSYTFIKKATTWDIYQDEVKASHDVVNLHPSVPVHKAINVLIDTLNNDKEQLKECTKLTLTCTKEKNLLILK